MQDGTYDAVLQLLEVKATKLKSGAYKYDCKFSDNTTKTIWEADEAREIGVLVNGAAFPVRYTVKKNGKYTNYNVVAFALPGDELPFDPEAVAAPEVAQVAAEAVAAGAATSQSGGNWDEATTARVSKLSVIGHAAFLVGNLYQGAGPEALEQALADVKKVGGELYKLARKHEQKSAQPAAQAVAAPEPEAERIQPTASTPAEVAEQVPGVVVGTSALPDAQPAGSGGMTAEDWD